MQSGASAKPTPTAQAEDSSYQSSGMLSMLLGGDHPWFDDATSSGMGGLTMLPQTTISQVAGNAGGGGASPDGQGQIKGYYVPSYDEVDPAQNAQALAITAALYTSTTAYVSSVNSKGGSLPMVPGIYDPMALVSYNHDLQEGLYSSTAAAPAMPVREIEAGDTVAYAMGLSESRIDADIAAGKTGFWDAAWYGTRSALYEAGNFASVGFWKRNDARLTDIANGRMSQDNYWTAAGLDAAGSIASLLVAGRVGGFVAGRLGATGYRAYMASGAAAGAAFDLTQQATGLGINAITNGQAGQDAFSWRQLTANTVGGAALGGVLRYAQGSEALNAAYKFQMPVLLESRPVLSMNGFGAVKGFQSPIAKVAGAPSLHDIVPYSTKAPGFEKHHGILDSWARANVPGYAGGRAPTVVLTVPQHNATRAVFNTWRAEQGLTRTKIDWTTIPAQESQTLTYRMFDAAGVPKEVTADYIQAFNQHIYGP
jgi:hypothetical protein